MISGSLDTNVILRLILNDLPDQHERVKKLVSDGKRYKVSSLAICETIFVLNGYYKLTREETAIIINHLLSNEALVAENVLISNALKYYIVYSSLSFEDCYLTAEAEAHNHLPLFTFDKKLANGLENCTLL